MLFIHSTTNSRCRDGDSVGCAWAAIELDGVATELDATEADVEDELVDEVEFDLS